MIAVSSPAASQSYGLLGEGAVNDSDAVLFRPPRTVSNPRYLLLHVACRLGLCWQLRGTD